MENVLLEGFIMILFVQLLIGGHLRNVTGENAVGVMLLCLIWYSFIYESLMFIAAN
jgi:hypothetical protein